MTTSDEPKVEAITWVHDSTPTTVVVNGQSQRGRRLLVNNRRAAFLYDVTKPQPLARLDNIDLRSVAGGFEVEGVNADGSTEVWSHAQVPKRPGGCSSCGGGR